MWFSTFCWTRWGNRLNRAAWVAANCNGNAELRRKLESLLAVEARPGDFLARKALSCSGPPARWMK
jgi:hypothetical protein